MNRYPRLTKVAIVAALTSSLVAVGAQSAQAMPTDIAGDRVSWSSQLPCVDGGGVSLNAAPRFYSTGAGSYQTRLGLYTSAGARLSLAPLYGYTFARAGWFQSPRWTTTSGYAGNAYVTAYEFKWNGSGWALIARESIPCV